MELQPFLAAGLVFSREKAVKFRLNNILRGVQKSFLRNCMTVAADDSTTVLEALRVVGDDTSLKVLTNAVEPLIASEEMAFQIISTGGIFNRNALAFYGETAAQTILRYHVDLALIGCAGLDLQKGVTDSNESEIVVKRTMLPAGRSCSCAC